MSREGSLEAPTRYPLDRTSDAFYEEDSLISRRKSKNDRRSLRAVAPGSTSTTRGTCPESIINHWIAGALAVFMVNCMIVNGVQAQGAPPLNKDFEEKPWEEQKQQLPSYPKDLNLKQIDVGPVTSFRFFVDTESVNVGTDGVVRFTLVARSESGASNVSFEGLRCKTQERKIYAVGRADGTWVAARSPAWTVLARQYVNPAHTVLYEDFFCPARNIVSSTSEAVDSIKNGGKGR